MVQKYIIDKSDLPNLIQGKELALGQGNKFRAFCIEINGELTNGDVIKAIFPDAENIRMDNGLPLNFVLEFELHRNYKDWWNSPYKAGDTDGKSD